jgi:hypothetical protein
MIRTILKDFGILFLVELVMFFAMVIVNMTDEKPPAVSRLLYWALKYVFSFPINLVNCEYPFFLDRKDMPGYSVLLIIINNSILTILIVWIRKLVK